MTRSSEDRTFSRSSVVLRGAGEGTVAGAVAGVLYPAIAFPVAFIVPMLVDPSPYLRFDIGVVFGMTFFALLYGWPIGLPLGLILGFCAGLGCGLWLAFSRRLRAGNIARARVRLEAAGAAGVSLLTVAVGATFAIGGGDPIVTDLGGWLWVLALGPMPALIAGGWAALRSPRILMSGFAVGRPERASHDRWGTPEERMASVAELPQ